jgi:asparagine synthase (glutamine-hydrolysing)
MPWDLPALVDGDLLREGLAALQPPRFLLESVGELPKQDYAAIAALEATSYLRNQLLRDSDWASMAHSLELRTPLVDYRLLRELAPVLVTRPAGMEGKVPLAMAPQSALPDAVLNRRKSGFALPMARWLERSMVLDEWRGEESLRRSGTPWARRMAFALLARHLS